MDYGKYILTFISRQDYIPVEADILFAKLGFNEGERGIYKKALAALSSSGRIVITKHGKVSLPQDEPKDARGTFMAAAKGFGFVRPEGETSAEHDVFIPARLTRGAIDGDVVSYTARPANDGRAEGKITDIIEHSITHVVGTLTEARVGRSEKIRWVLEPDRRALPFLIYVDNASDVGARSGDKAEAYITAYPDLEHDALGHVTAVFGASDTVEANYSAILHTHGVRTSFPREAALEAQALADAPVLPQGRIDLRDAIIFTLDGAESKDLDDAISVVRTDEGYELGVHIADVSHYVTEGSALDGEALSRGTSVYFADQVVPMLPQELSNGICSLNAGVDRYALSAFITLDRSGRILDTQVEATVIRSCVRGVYDEFNDLLKNGARSRFAAKYSPVAPCLSDIVALYKILLAKSKAKGAMELETGEAKIIVENGEVVGIEKRERGTSERMIEQFMLCANEAVAMWMTERGLPCIYRTHAAPGEEKLRNLRAFAHNAGLDISRLRGAPKSGDIQDILEQAKRKGIDTLVGTVVLRAMMKARYSEVLAPHFGLNTDCYCHFTSPIRRYPDLACHRIIHAALDGRASGTRLELLYSFAAKSAELSSDNERRAIGAEREIDDLYKCVYMRTRLGAHYEGRVSGMSSGGIFVELDNTCEGFVPANTLRGYFTFNERSMTFSSSHKIYRLGDVVRVKIDNCDLTTRRVYMEIE